MRSWQTLLCSRLRSSAVGTNPELADEEHGRAWHPRRRREQFGQLRSTGTARRASSCAQRRAPVAPGHEDRKHHGRQRSGTQPPSCDLGEVAGEHEIDHAATGRTRAPTRSHDQFQTHRATTTAPNNRRDDHGADDRGAIGRRERARDCRRRHEQTTATNMKRSRRARRSGRARRAEVCRISHARQQVELHRFARHGKRARDRRLRGDDRGGRCEHDERRQQRSAGASAKNGFAIGASDSAAAHPGRNS